MRRDMAHPQVYDLDGLGVVFNISFGYGLGVSSGLSTIL